MNNETIFMFALCVLCYLCGLFQGKQSILKDQANKEYESDTQRFKISVPMDKKQAAEALKFINTILEWADKGDL